MCNSIGTPSNARTLTSKTSFLNKKAKKEHSITQNRQISNSMGVPNTERRFVQNKAPRYQGQNILS